MTTIHQEAQWLFDLYTRNLADWRKDHVKCPEFIARKCISSKRRTAMKRAAKEAHRRADERNTQHLYRDYRPGIGSGRTADWLNIGFENYSLIARQIHRDTGYSGEEVRQITRALRTAAESGHSKKAILALADLPPLTVEPEPWDNGYTEEFEREISSYAWDDSAIQNVPVPVSAQRWQLYYRWNLKRVLGEHAALKIVEMVRKGGQISGYLAASILAWRKGQGGYEGCSGCESYAWLKQFPQYWDELLAAAPIGKSGEGWEQVYPHEHERAARLQAAGWHSTLRMNDTIYTQKHPVAEAV